MRPTRDQTLAATAFIWAQRGTCSRLQVGCVIHREGRILATGYNGAPAGLPHCDHSCNCGDQPGEPHLGCRSMKPCLTAVHAEQNAIAFAARHGVGLEGSELVVTHQPCNSCAMSIINAGITRVDYCFSYRLEDGLNLLKSAGIAVERHLDWDQMSLIEFNQT